MGGMFINAEIVWRKRRMGNSEYCDDCVCQTCNNDKVKELREKLKNCWHIANCYDGNHVKACDDVMEIARAGFDDKL